jgi:hypothetical protein
LAATFRNGNGGDTCAQKKSTQQDDKRLSGLSPPQGSAFLLFLTLRIGAQCAKIEKRIQQPIAIKQVHTNSASNLIQNVSGYISLLDRAKNWTKENIVPALQLMRNNLYENNSMRMFAYRKYKIKKTKSGNCWEKCCCFG